MRVAPANTRCQGITRSGVQCANPKTHGHGFFCYQHADQDPQTTLPLMVVPASEDPFAVTYREMLGLVEHSRSVQEIAPVTSRRSAIRWLADFFSGAPGKSA